MGTVLAIDTAGPRLQLALSRDYATDVLIEEMPTGQAERIGCMLPEIPAFQVSPQSRASELIVNPIQAGLDEVQLGMLPFAGAAAAPTEAEAGTTLPPFDPAKSYRDTKAEFEGFFEQRYVAWLLEQADGNISAAARAADMDRKYLHKLVRKHGLHPKG